MAATLIQIFHQEYRRLRPQAAVPEIHASYYHFADINNTIRLRAGAIHARVSDLLQGAPAAVLAAIAHILLAKLYRQPVGRERAARYRRHIASRDLAVKANLIRQMRGRKRLLSSAGHIYDLEAIFEDLNTRFFHGLLGRPNLTWSGQQSRQRLGHYDPAHNTIVVSSIFDDSRVPRYAIEYLLYHEMLHLKHPVRLRGSRRCFHSPEFQAEEKLFTDYEAALRFLKRL